MEMGEHPLARVNEPPVNARKRIVDAAVHCIARDGVAGTSMATIADEGHVSKALLHYHFRDRDHLLAAAVTTLADRITRRERWSDAPKRFDGPSVVPIALVERRDQRACVDDHRHAFTRRSLACASCS